MDTQIEQLNLSSITKFALAYAGITTVSELKEYNYISLANVLPRNCSLNPIMKELNTYGYIFPPENEIPIAAFLCLNAFIIFLIVITYCISPS